MSKRHLKGRGPQCHCCNKYGHIQKSCTERIKAEERSKQEGSETLKGKRSEANQVGLVMCYALGVREPTQNWIVDSGATCHICNSKRAV